MRFRFNGRMVEAWARDYYGYIGFFKYGEARGRFGYRFVRREKPGRDVKVYLHRTFKGGRHGVR